MSSYFKIRLFSVPANIEDLVTEHSFKYGASGLAEALVFSQPDLTYDPEVIYKKSHDLDVFFSQRPDSIFFDKLLEMAPHLTWEVFEEENKDWLEEWKKGFVPFKLVGSYWIVPSWHVSPDKATQPIYIDPGMAFGTGTHATTRMASYFIYKLGKVATDKANKSLIDVGTGTALLAIMSAKEGFGRVLAIDIDPEARRVAQENVKLNNCSCLGASSTPYKGVIVSDSPLEFVHEQFDYVVANIIDGVLIQLKSDLLRILKPGGDIFLTGILLEREDLFFNKFIENSGLQVIRRLEDEEWVGYWLRSFTEDRSF